MSRLGVTAGILVALGGALWSAVSWWRAKDRGLVQRGWAVAEAHGCFGCHGPGGVVGLTDPGGGVGGVPTFFHDDVTAHARDESEIREWILDGRLRRFPKEDDPGGASLLIEMPAWRDVLTTGEVDALVAYVGAASNFRAPGDPRAQTGREAAARLGCFGCHGPGGRGAVANPRSLKGYVPPWDGPDFGELVRDERELREWILDGRPRRLQDNPIARWFLDRQALKMPAYRGHLETAEADRIVDYIHWLRR